MATNPMVNTGLTIIAKRLMTQAGESGSAQPEPKYLGWGTGSTAWAATQTALVTPAPEARVSAAGTNVTVVLTNDGYQVVATLTSAAGATITELGQFDASTSGNMLARWVFTGVVLAAGDGIQFTTQIYGT